jgi:hypothetical protein
MSKPIPPPPPVIYSSEGPQPKREKSLRTKPTNVGNAAKVERVLGFRMTTIQYRKVK